MQNRKPDSAKNFRPYISPRENPPEFTLKAILVGIFFGILFGAANAYLGLLAGLTVSTSIPVAVMSVGFFNLIHKITGRKANILEANISQTTGSASSSLASGIIFTIPALYLWGLEPTLWQMSALALLGGLLGILFMIPLRRFLIKEEHEKLPYPEGTACAKVLIASDKKGSSAKNIFLGILVGLVYRFISGFLVLIKEKIYVNLPFINKAKIGLNATPALLGVGYILGIRIATIMVSGGLISWLILIPMFASFGDQWAGTLFPATDVLISGMSASEIWNSYIRYIGAGAVAFGGIITIIRSIPTMVRSFRIGVDQIRSRLDKNSEKSSEVDRTDKDLPIKHVIIGVILAIAVIMFIPGILGGQQGFSMRMIAAPAIAIFSFFFVTVSSRIVGLVGVSSNPTSGMTIVTLLGISSIFAMLGWTDEVGHYTALTVGTVVCVAASIAGDTSQDLKTGFLVGATPDRQQISELLGASTSALAVCASIMILAKSYTFGSTELPAPQAVLIKTIIDGVLNLEIPWGLVLIGVGFGVLIELVRLPSLPFAVGLYLPVSTMTPIFIGGLIRYAFEKKYAKDEAKLESHRENGILFSSGLIGGQGFLSVGIALYALIFSKPEGIGLHWSSPWGELVSLAVFSLMAYALIKRAKSS